jgi:hypothetical protein
VEAKPPHHGDTICISRQGHDVATSARTRDGGPMAKIGLLSPLRVQREVTPGRLRRWWWPLAVTHKNSHARNHASGRCRH